MKTISIGDILYDKQSNSIMLVRQFSKDCFGQVAALCATNESDAEGPEASVFTCFLLFKRCVKLGNLTPPKQDKEARDE